MSHRSLFTGRGAAVAATAVLAATALAACGSDDGGSTSSGYEGEIGAIDLSESCPATVVVQTDWNPEAEHGHIYELLGPDPVVDAGSKKVTGPLFASGEYTGVDLEVRVGGPAIGFQTVSSQMYADTDIMLGFVDGDQAVQVSDSTPVTAVFAPLDINPLMVMWDPATYPDVQEIADLKDENVRVITFESDTWISYMTGAGILDEAQIDGSYDGSTSLFVAAGGEAAQQGFVSSEIYVYEQDLPEWNKPLDYQLIHDAGFPAYKSAMSVRTGELEQNSACLEQLVPVLQQGLVDYVNSPEETNTLMIDLVEQYNTGWVYTQPQAEWGLERMKELELVGNGHNETVGDFEESRVDEILEITTPIFTEAGITLPEGLSADTVMTNEFIDESISLN